MFIKQEIVYMLIIAKTDSIVKALIKSHDVRYEESQRIRMKAIADLKDAGLALMDIQSMFKTAIPNEEGLILTDLGAFKSFDEYLISGAADFKKTRAYECIKLAKNWHVVIKLGMQDSNHLKRSMRLCRTLKIIDWYNQQVAAGTDESELTLDLYWQLEDAAKLDRSGPTKKQLLDRIAQLESYVEQLLNELTIERSKQ
jgi:hypothetical protein